MYSSIRMRRIVIQMPCTVCKWYCRQTPNLLSQLNIPLNIFEVERIFGPVPSIPAPATAKVYVIANATNPARAALNQIMTNASAATPSYTGTSIKSLKYLEINKYGPYISQTEPSFVMDGSAVVTLTADRTTVTGHVKMNRSACKIRLFITEIEEVTTPDGTWIPQPQYMRLFIFNGTRKTRIDETLFLIPQSEDYFTIRGNNMILARTCHACLLILHKQFSTGLILSPTTAILTTRSHKRKDPTSLVLVLPWLCPIAGHSHSHNTYYQIRLATINMALNSSTVIYIRFIYCGYAR